MVNYLPQETMGFDEAKSSRPTCRGHARFASAQLVFVIISIIVSGSAFGQTRDAKESATFFYTFDGKKEKRPSHAQGLATARERLQMKPHEELKLKKRESDAYGMVHERYQQEYKGIPVEHGIVIVHSKGGEVTSINGEYYPVNAGLSITPSLTEEVAYEKAKEYVKATKFGERSQTSEHGQVVIYENKLAWKTIVRTITPVGKWIAYIDAQASRLLGMQDQLRHATGTAETRYSGTQQITTSQVGQMYVLKDYSRGQGIFTYNLNHGTDPNAAVDFTDNDNNWTNAEHDNSDADNGALDAHWAMEKTYDYWQTRFARNSYDGNGSPMIGYIHYGNNIFNAFWDNAVYIGDMYLGPWTFLDVPAHELGHGLLDSYGNFYGAESSAIKEGFADINAAWVTKYVNNQNILSQPKDVWKIFEEQSSYRVFNSLRTYFGSGWNPNNSHNEGAVLRYCFYVLVNGGSGVNENNYNYNVSPIGFHDAETIFYSGLSYVADELSFSNFKWATLQAAENIFTKNSSQYSSLIEAWNAVGVPDPILPIYCTPGNGPQNYSIKTVKLIQKMPLTAYKGYQLLSYAGSGTNKDIVAGRTYPLTLENYPEAGLKYWKIWLDIDKDGQFNDQTETIYSAFAVSNDLITSSLVIPNNITYGPTRLRVGFSTNPITSCSSNGDFRDWELFVLPPAQLTTPDGYCIPYGIEPYGELIGYVKMGQVNNGPGWGGGGWPAGGFAQFGLVEKIWQGETYNLTLKPKFFQQKYDEYFTVWLDWNADKQFDTSEMVYQGSTQDSLMAPVLVPLNSKQGLTHMRIAMSRNGYSPGPCSPFEFGEVIDKPVNIQPSQPLSADGYCSPRGSCYFANAIGPYDFKISSITVGPWNFNINKNYNTDGYREFQSNNIYSTGSLQMAAGQLYNIQLQPVSAQTSVYWTVWADMNNDKTFEATEVIFHNSAPVAGATNGFIALDASSVIGAEKLRVALSFFYPFGDACGIIEYGQMMDFSFQVVPPSVMCQGASSLQTQATDWASIHVNWQPGGANDYEVQYKKASESLWVSKIVNGATQEDLINLSPGETYDIRVRSVCSNQYVSDWLYTQELTPCPAPVQNLSYQSVTPTSAQLSWQDLAWKPHSKYLVSYNGITKTVSGDQFIILSGLTPGTQYGVTVQILNCQVMLPPSVTFATVCPQPATPFANSFPSDPTSGTITWKDAYGPVGATYKIYYREYSESLFLSITVHDKLEEQIKPLVPGTSYFFKISRVCSTGETEAFPDPPLGFATVCPQPKSITAVSDITPTTAKVTWEDPFGPAGATYKVYYKTSLENSFTKVVTVQNSLSTTLLSLEPGMNYNVKISRVCISGETNTTPFGYFNFATICPMPTAITSVSEITVTSAKVNWSDSNGPTGAAYKIYYKSSAESSYSLVTVNGKLDASLTLSPGTTYQVKVARLCPSGESPSTPQPDYEFTTLCPPPAALSSVTNITSTSARVTWTDPYGPMNGSIAASYRVSYRAKSESTYSFVTVSGQLFADLSLSPSTIYQVKVTRLCPSGESAATPETYYEFSTLCPAPTSLSATAITSTGAHVTWIDSYASTYTVEYRKQIDLIPQYFWTATPPTSNDYYDFTTQFTPGTNYEVRVKGSCTIGGTSSYSSTLQFTTLCPTPTGLSATDIDVDEIDYSWTASAGAVNYNFLQKVSSAFIWPLTPDVVSNTGIAKTTSPGTTYQAKVQAVCEDTVSPYTSLISVTTPAYCTASGADIGIEWIDFVSIAGTSRSSGSESYHLSTSPMPNINAGSSFILSYSAGIDPELSPRTESWRAWIDYNHDGDFADAGELVMSNLSSSTGLLSTSVVVPTTAESGYTRLRIAMKNGGYPASCGSFSYGEVEDYKINILGGSSASARTASAAQNTSELATESESIEDETSEKDIVVYPNPAKHRLTIQSSQRRMTSVGLYDVNGKTLAETKLSGETQHEMDVSRLPKGVVLLKVQTTEGMVTRKVILKE